MTLDNEYLVCTPEQFLAAEPAERRKLVRSQIDLTPELWRQAYWRTPRDCGTAYCFAGWALNLAGEEMPLANRANISRVSWHNVDASACARRACELLGLEVGVDGDHELFYAGNSLYNIDVILDRNRS